MGVIAMALSLLASACGGSSPSPRESAAVDPSPATSSRQPGGARQAGKPCSPDAAPAVDIANLSASTIELAPGGEGSPRVEAVVYPRPSYEGRPWSQWGQGMVLEDGRFLSAIGDHCGIDGNAYLYQFDPGDGTLSAVADIASVTDHEPGTWGYGKIHAQLVPGPSGDVYLSTYWGTRRGILDGHGYAGDLLLRYDPAGQVLESLGVPVPGHGIPSLGGWTEGGLLYGEAVDSGAESNEGSFFVYDTQAGKVVFEDDDPDHIGFRDVLVGPDGMAYYSAGEGRLKAYDPATSEVGGVTSTIPGESLRSSTAPAPDGTVYGVTSQPGELFALRPSGEIDGLGPARGDVASIAVDPTGRRLFYVPEAHGASWKQGAPLIGVDTRTGDDDVVVALNDLVERELGLRLGGTYDVAVDPSGETVYVGFNAGEAEGEDTFGEVVLVVVHLP